MREFGASSYLWVSPFGSDTLGNLMHAKKMGFDIYEIGVENPALIDIAKLVDEAAKAEIKIRICGAFGEERDISSDIKAYRRTGLEYVKTLIDMAQAVGSDYVAGPMYAATGRTRLASNDEKAMQRQYAVANLKELADYAGTRGIKLAIEPLNRFETDFLNTVDQGLELLWEIGYDNVGFLLDTFHMNIEEKSLSASIIEARGRIFDFHACANDRGTPGEDHFNWMEIKNALEAAEYDGPIVIESFTQDITEIARAVSLWRPLASSNDTLAKEGLRFLKSVFA